MAEFETSPSRTVSETPDVQSDDVACMISNPIYIGVPNKDVFANEVPRQTFNPPMTLQIIPTTRETGRGSCLLSYMQCVTQG